MDRSISPDDGSGSNENDQLLYQDAPSDGDQHGSACSFRPRTECAAYPAADMRPDISQYQCDDAYNCCRDPDGQTDQAEGYADRQGIQTRSHGETHQTPTPRWIVIMALIICVKGLSNHTYAEESQKTEGYPISNKTDEC